MFMVPDTAWKFGCGRYIQKFGALQELGKEIKRLGSKPLLISGVNSWNVAKEAVLDGLGRTPFLHVYHRKSCCEEAAHTYAEIASGKDCDVIVGIGGGVLMDTAKLTAEIAGLPVLTVPTLSATCAAFAPLSVVYTLDGRTRGSWFYEKEVDGCLVDMDILSRQPLRYAASGIVDSLAKALEIRHNLQYESPTPDLAFAQNNAEYLFKRLQSLSANVVDALTDAQQLQVLEEMVYLTIPATGIVSGAARGRMQSALGHCLYESVRIAFTKEASNALHGELVGIGLRMQLIYDYGNALFIDPIMKNLDLPMKLSDVNIPFTEDNLKYLLEEILCSSYTKERNYDVSKLIAALKAIW